MANSHATSSIRPSQFWLICVAITLVIFAAIAPTLRWLEFSNPSEGLNVATAQEIHRTGHWLVPTLQGEERLEKPPLTAWITALCISADTMQGISSPDPAVRDHAFVELEWQTRWPALLAACITLLLTAELGRLLVGPVCGIASLIVIGTSLLFLRYVRYSATDVHLAMWVAAGNVFLLHALVRGRRWFGFIGAGIALGLAMLSKGPVSLVQSIVPIAIWFAWLQWSSPTLPSPSTLGEGQGEGSVAPTDQNPHPNPLPEYRAREFIKPAVAGLALFLILGFSWFVLVFIHNHGVLSIWFREVTREGARDFPASHWYSYFSLFAFLMPWTIFWVLGIVIAIRRRGSEMILLLLLLFVPILIMSLARDRNERYLLPLLPAAAILAGVGIQELIRNRIIVGIHSIVLLIIGVGFPLATTFMNPPWYTPLEVASTVIAAALIIDRGFLPERHDKQTPLLTTCIIMLAIQAFFILGYRNTRQGSAELRPLAEQIATRFPNAEIFNAHPRGKRPPTELGVYLNRTLQWTDDPTKIVRGPVPKILLMLQNEIDPDPTPPTGWELVMKHQRDSDWWWAFELQPAQ